MYNDSFKACEIEATYYRALSFLRLGEASVELGKSDNKMIDKGIEFLNKALHVVGRMDNRDHLYHEKDKFEKQVKTQIQKAKKAKWFKQ